MSMAAMPAGSARPSDDPDPEVPARARMRSWPASYKARILNEYEGLDRAGKGALLRREGLYTSLISEWRKQRDHGARAAFTQKRGRPEVDPRDREVARLRKELSRAESELDKARKVIEIQSKLSAYAGDPCQEASSLRQVSRPSKSRWRSACPLAAASSRWRSRVGRNSGAVAKNWQLSQMDSKRQSSSAGLVQ